MSPAVPTASVALKENVRAFLRAPTHEGLFVHCAEEGVDLVLQVLGESPARLAATCDACGHRNRYQHAPRDTENATCGMCNEALGALAPAEEGERYHAFAWRVAWPLDGLEGLAMGRTIDEGRFTDAEPLAGIGKMHACLRVYLPLFEALNVTTMRDYRALTDLNAPQEAHVRVAES